MKYQLENFSGSYDFRSGFHRDWYMEPHIHEYCELLYCQKGEAEVTVNGKILRLQEKHLVWIPPNCVHQYRCQGAEVVCAVFSHDFIPLYFAQVGRARPVVKPVNVADLAQVIEGFPWLDRRERLTISGWLNLICARAVGQAEMETTERQDGILYQKVVSYLSEHFREDISLSSLAATFGYNEKYLSHCLHSLTGMHFNKLLALYRIEHAKKRLTEGRVNIGAVAMECGFSAVNTFNRNFREIVGMTPSEYKKTASQI